MEMEDETTPYLKFFNEGSHNYFLQSSEDGLSDAFSVEPIFTQLTPDWPVEGLPILVSGSLVAEGNNAIEAANPNVQVVSDESESLNEHSNSVALYPNINQNVILSNDLFLRIEESEIQTDNTIRHVINGHTYSISYEPEAEDETEVQNESAAEIIHLLNEDGSVTRINRNVLDAIEVHNKNNIENYFTKVQANKCKLCSFLCETLEEMTAHISSKHSQMVRQNIVMNVAQSGIENIAGTNMKSILNINNEKKNYVVFFCSECGNAYSNKENLKQHMVDQHHLICATSENINENQTENAIPQLSDLSKTKLTNRAASISLLKKQKTSKKIKCSIKGCPFKFAKDEYRKRHEECHVNNEKKQFMCPECKEKFSIWRICNMHLWKCHKVDLGLLTCPMCNQFKANSTVKVLNHMRIHDDEKPFVCSYCGKRFKQMCQMKNHEITHKSPEESPEWSTLKQCDACKRCFANSKCLKKHIKFVHDKFKPFICNICGHQTSRKEMLQIHYRQHTGDKPYHCTYCEYKSADRNCLRRHTMKHFGMRKYSCPFCEYQSIQTGAYKAHIANKHPGKEGAYFCSDCTYTTVNGHSYLAHRKGHELEQKAQDAKDKTEQDKVNDLLSEGTESKSNETKESSTMVEDDETQNFLNNEHSEDVVDTGGITIPAGFDLQLTNTKQ